MHRRSLHNINACYYYYYYYYYLLLKYYQFNIFHLQVAFIGRTSVGKSSLINALLNQTKLVKTSKRPVCTSCHILDADRLV